MTNREKFKEVFGKDIKWSEAIEPQMLALKSAQINGIDCMGEWLNAEYKEPTTRNCFGCKYSKDNHNAGTEECHLCMWENQYTPTTKNDLGIDCIDRAELLKAIDTWDKFGCDADTKLVPYQDHYIPYIHYDDVIKCIKSMPSVTPQLSSELDKNSKKLEKDFGGSDCISRADALRVANGYCHPSNVAKELAKLPPVTPQEPCDKCEVGNPCLYCKHKFEPRESEGKE